MAETLIVDSEALEWESGLAFLETLTENYRKNLGPEDKLVDSFGKYKYKKLYLDEQTGRRFDLTRLDAGYGDLTNSYHDCTEEMFFIDGECYVDGEGSLYSGDYFWRPPGWVHRGSSESGCSALLSYEGNSDESGPITRNIRPDEDAGSNAIFPAGDERALGTRGWVKRLETRYMVWQPGEVFARTDGPCDGFDLERVSFKVLSKNPATGKQTLLAKLDPGYCQVGSGRHSVTQQAFLLSGSVALGKKAVPQGGFLHRPGGVVEGPMTSESGAMLFLKMDGWLDFHLVA